MTLLTACAEKPEPAVVTKIQEVRQQVPRTILTCADDPSVPARPIAKDGKPGHRKQSQIADYVIDLKAAADDCRGKLGEVGKLVSPAPAK